MASRRFPIPLILVVGAMLTPPHASPGVSKYDDRAPFLDSAAVSTFMPSAVTVLKDHRVALVAHKDTVGGGVVIRANKGAPLLILTAAHVAEELKGGGYVAAVAGTTTLVLPVTLLRESPASDLAILMTGVPWQGPAVAARLAAESPRRGEHIWLVGSPAGVDRSISSGVISAKVPCPRSEGSCYRTDAELFFGSSGGGVFDDAGRLVGIADYVQVEYIEDANGERHRVPVPGGGGILSWNTVGQFLEYNMR